MYERGAGIPRILGGERGGGEGGLFPEPQLEDGGRGDAGQIGGGDRPGVRVPAITPVHSHGKSRDWSYPGSAEQTPAQCRPSVADTAPAFAPHLPCGLLYGRHMTWPGLLSESRHPFHCESGSFHGGKRPRIIISKD